MLQALRAVAQDSTRGPSCSTAALSSLSDISVTEKLTGVRVPCHNRNPPVGGHQAPGPSWVALEQRAPLLPQLRLGQVQDDEAVVPRLGDLRGALPVHSARQATADDGGGVLGLYGEDACRDRDDTRWAWRWGDTRWVRAGRCPTLTSLSLCSHCLHILTTLVSCISPPSTLTSSSLSLYPVGT